MDCPSCGAYIGDEDAFCGECGQPVLPKSAAVHEPSPDERREQEGELPGSAALLPPVSVAPAPARPAAALKARWPLIAGLLASSLGVCLCGVLTALFFLGRASITPAPGIEPAGVTMLYEESFDAPSGWDEYDDGDTWAEYAEGGYRLGLRRADYVTWGNPEDLPQFTDCVIEVDAWQVEGPLDNNLGLLVRYQGDDDNFYWFQISSDGYYAVDLLQAGEWVSIQPWEPSAAIRQGLGAVNHIVVECNGSEFSFTANGTHLATISEDSLPSGSIGLAAGAFDEAGVVIQFDNLVVTALGD